MRATSCSQHSRCELTRVEHQVAVTPLALLAMLFLMEVRVPLAFLATWEHRWLGVDQHPQVLFCQATFQPLFPRPVSLHGVVTTQVQAPALTLVECHVVGLSPLIWPTQIPLQRCPALKQINRLAWLGVVCKLSEGALDLPFDNLSFWVFMCLLCYIYNFL